MLFKTEPSGSQRGMKRELLGSERGVGPVNKNCRVILLPLTATVPMVDVKEEEDFVEEVLWSGVELSSHAKEAYEVLKRAIKSVCKVYDVSFQGLLESMEKSSNAIFE